MMIFSILNIDVYNLFLDIYISLELIFNNSNN